MKWTKRVSCFAVENSHCAVVLVEWLLKHKHISHRVLQWWVDSSKPAQTVDRRHYEVVPAGWHGVDQGRSPFIHDTPVHIHSHVKATVTLNTTRGLLLVYWTKLYMTESYHSETVALSVQFFSSLMKACVEHKCSVLYCHISGIKPFCHIWLWSHETLDESLAVWRSTIPQYIVPRWDFLPLSCTGVVWERCEWDPCGWDGIGQDHPVHLGDSTHGWDGGEGPFSNCCPPLHRSQLGGRVQKVHTNCKLSIISHHTKWELVQKLLTMLTVFTNVCLCILDNSFRALTYKMWPSDWLNQSRLSLCRSQWSSIMGRFQNGKGWEGRCLFGSERGNRRSFNR